MIKQLAKNLRTFTFVIILTTTPAPITLTGPIANNNQLIAIVTWETTSVFIGRNSIISQWTIDDNSITVIV